MDRYVWFCCQQELGFDWYHKKTLGIQNQYSDDLAIFVDFYVFSLSSMFYPIVSHFLQNLYKTNFKQFGLEHEQIHFFSERNESEISTWISDSVSFLMKYENQNLFFYETKFWKKLNFVQNRNFTDISV